ncbi:MAG: beta-ketoacyl-[Bacteroidales bacterium]|nr:beta-ketoacyl-[acyl-carrier-protein] synthase II [Bacteroidales bacterium]
MEPKRVVITGMGIISCIGQDLETYWNNLVNGVCGIHYVEAFKDMPVTFAGKVKNFDAEKFGMDKPFIRKQDN